MRFLYGIPFIKETPTGGSLSSCPSFKVFYNSLCFFLSDIQGGCCFRVFIFVLGFASRLKIRTFAIPNGGNGLTESGQRQQGDKKKRFFFAELKNLLTFADPNGKRFRKGGRPKQKEIKMRRAVRGTEKRGYLWVPPS